MKKPWSREGQASPALRELEAALEETRLAMAQAYAGFNTAADQELVESYIYEIQALKSRYSYLLRQRKALESAPAPARRQGGDKTAAPSALPVA